MSREDLMEELIDCVLNDDNSDEMIEGIRKAFNLADKAEQYKSALLRIKNVALNNDDYSLVADTQQIVIEIVDEAIK